MSADGHESALNDRTIQLDWPLPPAHPSAVQSRAHSQLLRPESALNDRATQPDWPLPPVHPSAVQTRAHSEPLRAEETGSQYGVTNISGRARVVVGNTYHHHVHVGNSIVLHDDASKQVALNQSIITSGKASDTQPSVTDAKVERFSGSC